MTIKVKYENGVLTPLQKIKLQSKSIYEIIIKRPRNGAKTKRKKEPAFLKFAGRIEKDDLDRMKKAIEQECEKVNHSDW